VDCVYLHVPRTKGRDVITNFSSKSPLSLAARLGLSLSLYMKHSIYLSDEISSIQRALNNQEVRFDVIISVSIKHYLWQSARRQTPEQSNVSYREKSNKMQQCIKMLLFLIFHEAQHVSGDTPPIIRSLKLHKQPLVLRTWKVVGRCSCWTLSGSVRYLTTSNNCNVRQPSTYANPEAACAVLSS